MGLADAFNPEDRVPVKYTDLYRMIKKAARAEIIEEISIVESNPAKAGAIIRKLAEYSYRNDE